MESVKKKCSKHPFFWIDTSSSLKIRFKVRMRILSNILDQEISDHGYPNILLLGGGDLSANLARFQLARTELFSGKEFLFFIMYAVLNPSPAATAISCVFLATVS